MLKSFALTASLLSFIFLAACADTTSPINESSNTTNTAQHSKPNTSTTPKTGSTANFKPSLEIDLKKAEEGLSKNERPLLDVLANNLNALVPDVRMM